MFVAARWFAFVFGNAREHEVCAGFYADRSNKVTFFFDVFEGWANQGQRAVWVKHFFEGQRGRRDAWLRVIAALFNELFPQL